jgi:hypothetical protein
MEKKKRGREVLKEEGYGRRMHVKKGRVRKEEKYERRNGVKQKSYGKRKGTQGGKM